MLEVNKNNVNVNVSNITGVSKVGESIVASFNASYSVGMMSSFFASRNITDMELYNENADDVDADYKSFENQVKNMVAALTAVVKETIGTETEEL